MLTYFDRRHLCSHVLRERIPEEAIHWLLSNGFLTAPASTCHHGAYDGGLFDHSIMVTVHLLELTRHNNLTWSRPESPYIVGMLHDLCKIDQYVKLSEPDGDRCYDYVETDVKGHGSKSVAYCNRILDLTIEEELCICYHMGAFTDREELNTYTGAIHRCPNVLWTHHADMLAAHVDKV